MLLPSPDTFQINFRILKNPNTTCVFVRGALLFCLSLSGAALTSCGTNPIPEHTTWHGEVELPEIRVPLTMELDLSSATPEGYFIVGNEKTPIPEISRNGETLTFNFSEYGAEIRATWSGRELAGEYRRLRSSGRKSFPFRASPSLDSPRRDAPAPTGTFQVVFEDESPAEAATVASIWNEGPASYYGTFIAPDGDYGLLEGTPTANGIQFTDSRDGKPLPSKFIEMAKPGKESFTRPATTRPALSNCIRQRTQPPAGKPQ
jgi:hypothetical protein